MRFQCPSCQTWQADSTEPEHPREERACHQCGALIRLTRQEHPDGARWVAEVQPTAAVRLTAEDPLRRLMDQADAGEAAARQQDLTGLRAQLISLTTCSAARLWLPAAAIVGLGLASAVGLVVVGQRIERALALLLTPLALGLVAWSMVIAASAVANVLHLRLTGNAVGMGRSLRIMLEHGNGAAGSALRFVVLGSVSATLCALLALLGAVPGLSGPGGLAVTGGLLWLQVLAALAAFGLLGLMVLALLLHPGLATAGPVPAPRMFRFVVDLLRRDGRRLVRRAAVPLSSSTALLLAGFYLLRLALLAVVSLNARILGPGYADLVSASPLRVLFGAPELLDPGTALGVGGFLMAASLTACAALVLGGVASYLGVSGYLLSRALDLRAKLTPEP